MRFYQSYRTDDLGVKMRNNIVCKENICFLLYTALTTALLATGSIFCGINRFVTGFVLVLVAVALYFFIVFSVAKKNWLDVRAVFHGVWVATVGLAALRLSNYQKEWQVKTWICLALAYSMFQIGAHLGMVGGSALFDRFKDSGRKLKIGRIRFELKESRYFWICIVTTLVGLACFLINVAIRGYVPCFSDDPTAYITFYTKFHMFSVAATGVSGFCYYCIATQNISKFKKVLLVLCILYETFLFPTLVVSRGTFIVSALSLTVAVFYIHKRKFWVLVTCLALIMGIYLGVSALRNYTDAQLEYFFEPSKIHLDIGNNSSDDDEDFEDDDDSSGISFTLPPKLSFVYTYLTVSHDNFNEAVKNSTECTYGLRQFAPFNVIFRLDWVEERLENAETYLVRPHLNTVNIIGPFYYDFHEFGIVVFMLLWSFIFGALQKLAELGKSPFFLFALGNAMMPVTLCFFSEWLSIFSQWMLWGVVLIFAVAATVKLEPRKKKADSEKTV